MVWTEKVHTFLFYLKFRCGEIMVVKSPLYVQKAAKKQKQNSKKAALFPLLIYRRGGVSEV